MYSSTIDRCKIATEAATQFSVRDKSTGMVYKYGDNAFMDMCIANCVYVDCNSDIVEDPDDYFGFNRSNWELIIS